MYPDDAADPAGRTVHRADGHGGLREFAGVRLEAPELLRLEEPDDTGVAEPLGAAVGQTHELVAFGTVRTDLVCELRNGVEHLSHDLSSSVR